MEPSDSSLQSSLRDVAREHSPIELAANEAFWAKVRSEYALPENFVHLEYGYYHPVYRRVLEVEIETMKMAQRRASHYKRNEMTDDREAARADLAAVAGADVDEIAITRNATEALNIIIHGLPLRSGDELVHSDQDYPSVVEALEQRARKDGLTLRSVPVPLHHESDDEIVQRFASAITARTRAMLITHVINFTGQVLPLRALCRLARQHNLWIVVDAAHSFAQIDFNVKEIDCDFLGASLHKWLGAPLGTGLLYVRGDRVASLEPLFGDTQTPVGNIRKLEHFGNRPDSAHVGLREAIRWHSLLTVSAKEARLRFLQQRWTNAARLLPRIKLLTPREPYRHGAIGAFSVNGRTASEVAAELMEEHHIFVNAFAHPAVEGVRVTPGLPTSISEIDRLIEALHVIAGS